VLGSVESDVGVPHDAFDQRVTSAVERDADAPANLYLSVL
jgi:hypothetical protein